MNNNSNFSTLKLAKMALMLAIATICSFFWFPILPGATFLHFEVSDIAILIAAFAFGPIPGLVVGVLSILLHDIIVGAVDGPYGMIMHVIAVVTLVLVAGFIYSKFKSKKGALTALIVGGLCMAAIMIPANLIVTPLFMGVPRDAVIVMLPTIIIPFNLIKVLILCVVVFFIYKRISPFLHKWGVDDPKREEKAMSTEENKDSSL